MMERVGFAQSYATQTWATRQLKTALRRRGAAFYGWRRGAEDVKVHDAALRGMAKEGAVMKKVGGAAFRRADRVPCRPCCAGEKQSRRRVT